MCQIVQNHTFDNIPPILTPERIHKFFPLCEACAAGTLSQVPVPTESVLSSSDSLQPHEFKLHADINVFDEKSFDGSKGALTILDDKTNYIWGYTLDNFTNLQDYLEDVRLDIKNHEGILKILKIDNQFLTKALIKWAKHNNVQLEPCIPHEHHQIGKIERLHRTITDSVRKCLHSKIHLSAQYWGMCYHDVIMKMNLLPKHNISNSSPYELYHKRKFDLKRHPMLPFGSVVMAHIPLSEQTKVGPRAIKHFAIGTSLLHQEGIKCFNPHTKRIIVRRTFKPLGTSDYLPINEVYHALDEVDESVTQHPHVSVRITEDTPTADVMNYQYLVNTLHEDDDDHKLYKVVRIGTVSHDGHDVIVAFRRRLGPISKNGARRFIRTADDDVPIHIADIERMYRTYNNSHLSAEPSIHASVAKSSSPMQQKKKKFLEKQAQLQRDGIPLSATELFRMPDSPAKDGFVAALQNELSNLKLMDTFSPVPSEASIPKHKIGHSKLIFCEKFHADGSFNKHKCRMVFLGDRWIDYYNNKTYAGTVMSESINLIFSIIAERDLEFIVADCRTAFLHSPVPSDQDIYMKRPPGLNDSHMPSIVKLNKCLYGLPMAPAQFRAHNHNVLTSLGFRALVSDPRVYRQTYDNGEEAIIMVHVDDMGIATTSLDLQKQIIDAISKTYTLELKID
jgi:hypothetical protein